MAGEGRFILIYNIPRHIHSKFLRRFFIAAVESNVFRCFHFRHTSSKYIISEKEKIKLAKNDTNVCFIKLNKARYVAPFISKYSQQPWNKDDVRKVYFGFMKLDVKTSTTNICVNLETSKFVNIDEITEKRLKSLPDLMPPKILKNGNVGTTLTHFTYLIRNCKLPVTLLPKLGIKLQNLCNGRKYSSIPWDYEKKKKEIRIAKSERTKVYISKSNFDQNIEHPFLTQEDVDEAEEWERYESIHEDPFKMTPKERSFEQEIEVVWEKGGPGLVWHTDANYWDHIEENDEKEIDDWEVNCSEHENMIDYKNEHYDILESFENTETSFNTPKSNKVKKKKKIEILELGHFEKFSKGFASEFMKKYGWKKGTGLGVEGKGIPEALHCEGQPNHDKTGLGFRGTKHFDFALSMNN